MVSLDARERDPPARQGTGQSPPPSQPPRLSGRSSYSSFVGLMKVMLPGLAVALILLVIVWPQIDPTRGPLEGGSGLQVKQDARNLHMINARFSGIDENSQPYTITADLATQQRNDQNIVNLERPKADMVLEDGAWVAIESRSGKYHREERILNLDGAVNLFQDEGFEMLTDEARIELDRGYAEGDEAVVGQGPGGILNAEGFKLYDRGKRIVFTGESRLELLKNGNSYVNQ